MRAARALAADHNYAARITAITRVAGARHVDRAGGGANGDPIADGEALHRAFLSRQ